MTLGTYRPDMMYRQRTRPPRAIGASDGLGLDEWVDLMKEDEIRRFGEMDTRRRHIGVQQQDAHLASPEAGQ